MATARLFPAVRENYQTSLLAVIDSYINKNQDKWLRRSGVARAKALKVMLARQLAENQQLNDLQLMWRMYSYIKMDRGVGPLESSTDLRLMILNHLCQSLHVTQDEIKKTEAGKRLANMHAMISSMNTGMVSVVVDEQKVKEEARLELAHIQLAKTYNPALVASEKCKNIFLVAIEAYQTNARTRWFKGEGIERAENLKNFINAQLIGREKLNDDQLCARLLELLRMPIGYGQGMLGTSKDLRHLLLKTMCEYMKLDERKMLDEIAMRSMPVFAHSSLGPVGYCPNYTIESIQVRVSHLDKLLSRRPDVIPTELADPDPRSIAFGH